MEKMHLLKSVLKIFLLFIASIIITLGCSDDPSLVGVGLVPDKDKVELVIINSIEEAFDQKTKTYADSLNLNYATTLLLGKHENVESIVMLKFLMFLPDSLKTEIKEGKLEILSSEILLRNIYTYGSKTNSFDFTAHKINSSWNSLTFNKDSLAFLDYEATDRSTNRVYSDTTISFDFDIELAKEWLDFSANDDQIANNNGLFLNYTPESDKLIGFPAISSTNSNYLATLKIIYQASNELIDTLTIATTSDLHVVQGEVPTGNPENIYVQGGIAVRSNIHVDVSQIPDNVIINEATLKIYYDESESIIGTRPSDSLGVVGLLDYDSNEYDQLAPPNLLVKDSLYYSGNITGFVQRWVSNKENHGLQIFLANEVNTVNKVALKGSTVSDNSKRPYLEIKYTSKK